MCEMKPLRRKCGTNFKEVAYILWTELSNVDLLPDPVTNFTGSGPNANTYHTIVEDIILDENAWCRIEFSKGATLKEPTKGNADGQSIETTIAGTYPENDAFAVAVVQQNIDSEGICIAVSRDGTMRVIGTRISPARITFNEDSTKGGFDVTVMCEGVAKSPYYTGAIAEA